MKAALKEGGSEGAALIRFRGGAQKAAAASQKPDLKADLRGYFGFLNNTRSRSKVFKLALALKDVGRGHLRQIE